MRRVVDLVGRAFCIRLPNEQRAAARAGAQPGGVLPEMLRLVPEKSFESEHYRIELIVEARLGAA
jgi:hypothetical protein